uniref:Putative secreted protein n=1 Tax=Ixodes ricinus TaxID=34613 RepID=A0A6B0URN4_IXORI
MQCLFELPRLRRLWMFPLTGLLFRFRCRVVDAGLVPSDNRFQEFLAIGFIGLKKFAGRFNTLPFVVFRKHSRDPPCTNLGIYPEWSVKILSMQVLPTSCKDHLAELPNRHPSIFQHCFFHFRNRFVRNRWPS